MPTVIVTGLLMLLSFAFLGWTTSQGPPGIGQLLLPALAIIAAATMFAFFASGAFNRRD